MRFQSLSKKDRKRFVDKFVKLCKKFGANRQDAEALLDKVTIESLPEDRLWCDLELLLKRNFKLVANTEGYLLAFLGKCLEWADKRKTVTCDDINNIYLRLSEGYVKQREFEAFGENLIENISWELDRKPNDFLDGKATRLGHIDSNLDIIRTGWMHKIDNALSKAGICIVKSASGQGKSTLIFRYARSYWPAEDTFYLNSCASHGEISKIIEYFGYREKMNISSFLIIDKITRNNFLWAELAARCSSIGVPVVVSIRNEDWTYQNLSQLASFETVEPFLELDEARGIYKTLQRKGRVHIEIKSFEEAFEKLSNPKLLMEYIFLLTHGEMLADRLAHQLQMLGNEEDSKGKIDIIRKIAAIHSAGGRLTFSQLEEATDLQADLQSILHSLDGEYIEIDDSGITGLHWVRSNHLLGLLHSKRGPDLRQTFVDIFKVITNEFVSKFVVNSLKSIDASEVDGYIELLAKNVETRNFNHFSLCMSGIFSFGEYRFFMDNKAYFDKVALDVGPGNLILYTANLLPTHPINVFSQLKDISEEYRQAYRKNQNFLENIEVTARGKDYLQQFLKECSSVPLHDICREPRKETAEILEWLAFAQQEHLSKELPDSKVFDLDAILRLKPEDVALWLFGIYCIKQDCYYSFVQDNLQELASFFRSELQLLNFELTQEKDVVIGYIVDDSDNTCEQSMRRLRILRNAFPFCAHYRSKGIYLLPDGIEPSVDDSDKSIPYENMPFESDIQKNVIFRETVEAEYLPETFFEFHDKWHKLRKLALDVLKTLRQFLMLSFLGKTLSKNELASFEERYQLFLDAHKNAPNLPLSATQELKDVFKEAQEKWATPTQNFCRLFINSASTGFKDSGPIVLSNIQNASNGLHAMDLLGDKLEKENGISLRAVARNISDEKDVYSSICDLVDCKFNFPPPFQTGDVTSYAKQKKHQMWKDKLSKLEKVQNDLLEKDIRTELPSGIFVEDLLSYIGIIVHVSDSYECLKDLKVVAAVLNSNADLATYFFLIPVYDGATLNNMGFRVSANNLKDWSNENIDTWESYAPMPVNSEVLELLPCYPAKDWTDVQTLEEGMIFQVQSYIKLWQMIGPFSDCTDKYEARLFETFKPMLRQVLDEFQAIASKITEQLSSEDVLYTDNELLAACKQLTSFNSYEPLYDFCQRALSEKN
ncbi:MAG: hypothetical protein KAQ98_04745 [Bacteriovoracaceae bacterium]|nr:hypothetical protein [Bacteriovoracaceae bacterium]